MRLGAFGLLHSTEGIELLWRRIQQTGRRLDPLFLGFPRYAGSHGCLGPVLVLQFLEFDSATLPQNCQSLHLSLVVNVDVLLQVRQDLGDLMALHLHLLQSPLTSCVTTLRILLQLLRVLREFLLQVTHGLHLLLEAVVCGLGHLLRLANLLLTLRNDGHLLLLEVLLCQRHFHVFLFDSIGRGRLLHKETCTANVNMWKQLIQILSTYFSGSLS